MNPSARDLARMMCWKDWVKVRRIIRPLIAVEFEPAPCGKVTSDLLAFCREGRQGDTASLAGGGQGGRVARWH
jgi:hypothetical protein